jgi:hypothetical protein
MGTISTYLGDDVDAIGRDELIARLAAGRSARRLDGGWPEWRLAT